MQSSNFYDYYNNIICPKIKSLDILYKGNYDNIDIKDIVGLLDISEKEIQSIINAKNIHIINSQNIPILLLNGSSYICRIFRRTLNINCPQIYTVRDIAYIYELDEKIINNICKKLNIKKITQNQLDSIFKQIKL